MADGQAPASRVKQKRCLEADEDDTPTKRQSTDAGECCTLRSWHSGTSWTISAWAGEGSPAGDDAGNGLSWTSGRSTSTEVADLCCGESIHLTPRDDAALLRGPHRHQPPALDPQPSHAEEFATEIIRNLYAKEAECAPSPCYLLRHGSAEGPHTGLDASMRAVAVSWLVEVASEFQLHQETLHLATSLLDRYLSGAQACPSSRLQLLAVACILIAAKHEEECAPSIAAFTDIADHSFTTKDLLAMENAVLDTLSFRVNVPTAYSFLCLFNVCSSASREAKAHAHYLVELAMLEYDALAYPASQLAATALLLAEAASKQPLPQASSSQAWAGVGGSRVAACAELLLGLQQQAYDTDSKQSPLHAVKEKYSAHHWREVGQLLPPSQTRLQQLLSAGPR